MAWIEKRKTSKGEVRYLVGWRERGTSKRVHESFHRLEDARTRKREVETALDAGAYVPKIQRAMPLERYITELLETDHSIANSTRVWYTEATPRIFADQIGSSAIGEITPAELRAFVSRLVADGVGNGRLDSIRQLLTKTFSRAVSEGVLARSPMRGVSFPKAERRKIEVLDKELIRAIADAIDPRYRAAVLLSAFGGLREGELGGLTIKDLDLPRGKVTIRRQARTVGSRVELAEPKTSGSRRTISIPIFVAEELASHIERFGYADDGRIFRAPAGTKRNSPHDVAGYQVFNKALRRALKGLGIDGPERPHWHDLRHSSAAFAIAGGAHAKAIQARLGHTLISTTLDTYGHLMPGLDEKIAEGMDQEWNRGDAEVVSLRGAESG